jgi:hypothetical protein
MRRARSLSIKSKTRMDGRIGETKVPWNSWNFPNFDIAAPGDGRTPQFEQYASWQRSGEIVGSVDPITLVPIALARVAIRG